MLYLLALTLHAVASDSSSAGNLRHARAAHVRQPTLESARRLAYPSVGELLTTPDSISELDVLVHKILHEQCIDVFMRGHTKEQILVKNLILNLTKYNLQSAATNVDKSANKISTSLTYANGSQALYTEQYTSRSFGCTISVPKYAGIMADAQKTIDALSYAPDMVLHAPERDVASFEEFSAAMCDTKYNLTRSLLIYQKGKLVWEKYCSPGVDKNSVETLRDEIYGESYTYMGYLPYIRSAEGKFDLDRLSVCPELTRLDKKVRNMTGRNLAANRIGRPLQNPPQGTATPLAFDTPKMIYAVPDKANYAAVAPSRYTLADNVNLEWQLQHVQSAGTPALLQRELRFTFPDTPEGFAEYAAYPWTHLFKEVGATSVTLEADATGTFVGHTGFYANSRDFLKLAILFQEKGMWNGKQILPLDYIDGNTGGRYGSETWFKEGWHSFILPGLTKLYYFLSQYGCIWVYPELEISAVGLINGNNPARWSELYQNHHLPWLARQQIAWATTTSTTMTTTTVTTTTTTVPTTTTTAIATTVTSTTLSQAASHGGKNNGHSDGDGHGHSDAAEPLPMSAARRSGSTLWMTILLAFMLRLSC